MKKSIRPAPDEFVNKGIRHIKVYESDHSVIYISMHKDESDIIGYEVWKRIVSKETILKHAGNQVIPPRVKKASDEAFGNTAWSPGTLDSAIYIAFNLDLGLNNYGVEWGNHVQVGLDYKAEHYDSIVASDDFLALKSAVLASIKAIADINRLLIKNFKT